MQLQPIFNECPQYSDELNGHKPAQPSHDILATLARNVENYRAATRETSRELHARAILACLAEAEAELASLVIEFGPGRLNDRAASSSQDRAMITLSEMAA